MSYQVEVSSLADYALINLRGEAQVINNWEAALEVVFPKAPHTAVINEAFSVLSLASDHWWVRTVLKSEDEVFRKLSQFFCLNCRIYFSLHNCLMLSLFLLTKLYAKALIYLTNYKVLVYSN